MRHCNNLYYLSSIACMLSECMNEQELELLSAQLRALGEMIETVIVSQPRCGKEPSTDCAK